MLVERRGGRVRAERRLAGQQLVDDTAEGVHVRRGIGRAAESPLGGQVQTRADDVPGRRQRRRGIVDELGDAEVPDLHRPVGVQHQVAGLDVAVDDALPVRRGQTGGGLARDVGDLLGVDRLLGLQQVPEAPALDQFHHQVEAVLPGTEVEHRHQVGVAQTRGRLRLQAEARGRRGVGLVAQQQLHRHGPPQDFVRGAPHLTHTATADGGYQPVPPSNQHLCTPISNCGRLRLPRRRPRRAHRLGGQRQGARHDQDIRPPERRSPGRSKERPIRPTGVPDRPVLTRWRASRTSRWQ